MGQFEDLRLFVAVVENGGIARAAKTLNVAKSAVSRRLGQLEGRYGVLLIDRRPGIWEVTTAGHELYERANQIVSDADELDGDFLRSEQSLRGPLTVSVAREFGLAYLKPLFFDFASRHSEIDLTVDFDDRVVDLDRENYDLAIRVANDTDDRLVARQLGVSYHGLFVSPSYAKSHGLPNTVEDLTSHPLLNYGSARRAEWEFEMGSKKRKIRFQPALNSNCGPFLVDAAVQGLGIARLPDFLSQEAVASGDIVQILPDTRICPWTIRIVYSPHRRLNRRMRALVDAMCIGCDQLCAKEVSGTEIGINGGQHV